jgi:hypothetical protein
VEEANTITENVYANQTGMNAMEGVGFCNFLIYYPLNAVQSDWNGWNFMPIAYLQ